MHLLLDGKGRLYDQLVRGLRGAIVQGRLKPGERLPPSRDLAADLAVSRQTVVTAYELLCAQGWAEARKGSGTYVADGRAVALPRTSPGTVAPPSAFAARLRALPPSPLRRIVPAPRFELQYGEPFVNPALLGAWRAELARAVVRADPRYPPAEGAQALREAIADTLARRRGFACDPRDVVVVNGTQQALTLLTRLLVDEGAAVALEDPCYPFAAAAAAAHGAQVVHVPTDEEGLVVARLPRAGVRMVLVTPSHQFPSGVELSTPRREALLAYAGRHDAWVVEDDYDGEFRYEARPVPALRALDRRGRVFYVGSFSKTVFPSLRLGYVVCPPGLRDDLVAAKRLEDMGCPGLEQAAMAAFIRGGGFDRHLRKAGAELRRRREALLAGLLRHCGRAIVPSRSRAGMHLVGWLPGRSPSFTRTLIDHARLHGVGLHAIDPFYRTQPPRTGLLLGYASLSVAQLAASTRILGECLREVEAG